MRLGRALVTFAGAGAAFRVLLSCASFAPSADGPDASAPALDAPPSSADADGIDADGIAEPDAGGCPDGAFCDDFDEGELGARWNKVTNSKAYRLSLDPTAPLSPPNALRVALSADAGRGPIEGMLEKVVPVSKQLRCSFAVRMEHPLDATRNVDVFQIKVEAPEIQEYWLNLGGVKRLGLRDDVYFLDGGCDCPRAKSGELLALEPGVWKRIVVITDYTSVSLAADGNVIVKQDFTSLTPSRVTVRLGLTSTAAADGDMSFDDLVCEFLE
jgi:hypothetical protein